QANYNYAKSHAEEGMISLASTNESQLHDLVKKLIHTDKNASSVKKGDTFVIKVAQFTKLSKEDKEFLTDSARMDDGLKFVSGDDGKGEYVFHYYPASLKKTQKIDGKD